MKNSLTPAGIEPATFRFVAQHLNHCATAVPNRNEYQEYFLGGDKGGRCVGLTTFPPSCASFLEIWEPQPPGTLRACPGLQWDCFNFTFTFTITFTFTFYLYFYLKSVILVDLNLH